MKKTILFSVIIGIMLIIGIGEVGYAQTPPPLPQDITGYFVHVNDQSTGPYDTNGLRQLINQNQLAKDTLVWKEGIPKWVIAGTVEELAFLFAPSDAESKPVKRVPVRVGNFEIIQGNIIKPPIDMGRFSKAVKSSLNLIKDNATGRFNMVPTEVIIMGEGTGYINFRIRRAPAWVDIKLCFWQDEYWYEYVNSYRYDADPAANTIHNYYRTYINRIENNIKGYY